MGATIDIIGKNGIKHSAVYEESSVRKFELMKEDYVRLVFSTYKNFAVSLGDYITLEDWGTFYITKPQKPTYNLTTGGYDYDLQFDAPHYRWNNKLYKFEPNTNRNEASWSLTDNLKNHMSVFLRNLEHHGWNYTVDTNSYQLEAANRYIYIQFDNCYLLDALTKIAEAFDVEWWITDNIIHFGKAEHGEIVDFEVGVNVQEMVSENSSKEYFTRIYAFGSTQNVPSGYRKNDEQLLLNGVVQKRVMLPASTPYVDVEENLTNDEIVEGIVIFDDVYPRLDNSITDLRSDEREVEKTDTVDAGDGESSDESETETVTIYRFKDSSLKFSKDYILPGVQLQVQFQSGKLNGMIFDIAFNPDDVSEETPDGQWFEIVRNDTYGVMLPNDILKPEKTNKFVLLGWDVTKLESGLGLITAAENEVLERTNEFAKDLQTDSNTYPCHMMSDYMFGLNNSGQQDSNFTKVRQFPLGQRIRLKNTNFFVGGSRVSRVVGYEYKLDKPYDDAVIYVGESATYSSKQAQEAKINEAMDAINYRGWEYTSYGGYGSNVYIITSNDNTTPTDSNVFSALKTDRRFARKDANDNISSIWTFKKGFISHGDAQFGDFAQGTSGTGIYKDENGNWHIETDFINARKTLNATSVQIQEAKHIGGELILSSANCEIAFVRNIMVGESMVYRCYFQKKDTSGKAISNKWMVGDQAYCKTFNLIDNANASVQDRYFWRLVVGVSKDSEENNETITIGNETYNLVNFHWIDLSINDCDTGSVEPKENDNVVQLGHREKSDGTTNTDRQNAIIISGAGEGSPYIREYTKINSFSLAGCLDTQLKPNDNILSGKSKFVYYKDGKEKSLDDLNDELNKGVGDLNNKFATFESEITDAITTTTTDIEKVQETISKLEYGKVNMLLNSGFTGDYLTSNLDSSSSLNADTKMFSPSLKYWECDKNHVSVEEYEYSQSGAKVNIEAGYSIAQTIPFQIHSGENYIFSFRGIGGDIYITIGGVTLGASMSNTWTRYINKFVAEQDTKIITIHATNTCSLCELQLEKGTIVSAWDISPLDNRTELARYEQLTYLQNILKSHTEIDGGIVSTGVVNSGLISMGNFNENGEMTSITAGLSGTYNTDNDPAFFAGGDMTKAISAVAAYMDNPNYEPTAEELRNMANVVITHGGRAILNDIILRGYVHALGGIFKGRVEASEGEFHGNVYAEAGVFNGTIKANSGSILNEDKQNLWSFDINIDSRDFTIKGPNKVTETNTKVAAAGAIQKEYVSIGKFVTQEYIEDGVYSICPQITMRSYGNYSVYSSIIDPFYGYRVAEVDTTTKPNKIIRETILNSKSFEFGGDRVVFANILTKEDIDKNPNIYVKGTLYNDNGTLKIKES